jgi:acetyl esterase/lipase
MWTEGVSVITIPYGPDPEHVGDLHVPAQPSPDAGLVVLVHGGFWRSYWRRDLMSPLAEDLVAAGAVVWNIEYRRVGSGGGVPHTLRDVAQAVDLLDLVGPRFGFGVSDVTVIGHSAGGHLAGWLAQRARRHIDGIHPAVVRPTRIAALAPVLDLVEAEVRMLGVHATAEFVGARLDEDRAAFERVSPAHHLPLGVPMAIVHGTADDRVPHELSVAYVDAARAAGDDVSLLSIDDADHFAVIDPSSHAWRATRSWLGL